MSMEKGFKQAPTTHAEYMAFKKSLLGRKSEVLKMLEDGKAYVADERDKDDNIKTFKVFSNDGVLLYFEDVVGLQEAIKKIESKKKYH